MLHLPTNFFSPPVWFIPDRVIDLFQYPWIHLHLLHLSFWVLAIWRLWAQVQIQLINGGVSDPWVSTLSNFWMRHQNTWERTWRIKKYKIEHFLKVPYRVLASLLHLCLKYIIASYLWSGFIFLFNLFIDH